MAGSSKQKRTKLPHWKRIAIDKFQEIRKHPDFDEDIDKLRRLLNYSDNNSRAAIDEVLRVAQLKPGPTRSTLYTLNLYRMINKYEAPRGVFELLKKYLLYLQMEDDLDPSEIGEEQLRQFIEHESNFPPIFLVSTVDNTVLLSEESPYNIAAYNYMANSQNNKRVLIELTADVQQQDLIDYIKLNYAKIEEKLRLLDPDRLERAATRLSPKRDYDIIKLYKEFRSDPKYKGRVRNAVWQQANENFSKKKRYLITIDTVNAVIKRYNKQNKEWGLIIPKYD